MIFQKYYDILQLDMLEKWRPAFIGTFNPRAHEFIRASNLTLEADVASKSHDQRIRTAVDIFLSTTAKKRESMQGTWIIDDFPDMLINSAKELIVKTESSKEIARDFFPKLIVVRLEAPVNSVEKDKETGIRAVLIKKGQLRFPTHPTPDS